MAEEGVGKADINARGVSVSSGAQLEHRAPSGYWADEAEDPFEAALRTSRNNDDSTFSPTILRQTLLHSGEAGSWSCLVIHESSLFRRSWSFGMVFVLCFVAVLLPTRLAFYDFGMPVSREAPEHLQWIEWFLEIFFWCDLVCCFLFTYKDKLGREVSNQGSIVRHYVCGFFIIDLVACMPPSVFQFIMESAFAGEEAQSQAQNLHKLSRIAQVQRAVRLTRLARLIRLSRLQNMTRFLDESRLWQGFSSLRSIRALKFVVLFVWFVHLCACGWIVCAALHDEVEETWMWRRVVETEETEAKLRLFNAQPFDQWSHAMYFVLTVFTTVGFGDMSGFTIGEIWYVSFTMMLGVVVNAVILSEIITMVTAIDHREKQRELQKALFVGFSKHAHLDQGTTNELIEWAGSNQFGGDFTKENRDAIRTLIRRNVLPRSLLGHLPDKLFQVPGSSLMHNKFVSACLPIFNGQLPPRFPLLMGLSMNSRYYKAGETVYFSQDHAFNIFLVLEGVFASTATPGPKGGWEDLPAYGSTYISSGNQVSPYMLYCRGNYFGEYEIFVDGLPRLNSIRCEPEALCEGGLVLVLSKDEMSHLIEDFPHAEVVWRTAAVRRRNYRQRLLRQLRHSQSAVELAANTIALKWRRCRLAKQAPAAASSQNFVNFIGANFHKIVKPEKQEKTYSAGARAARNSCVGLTSAPSTKGTAASNGRGDRTEISSSKLTKLEGDVRTMKADLSDTKADLSNLRRSVHQMHALLQDIHSAIPGCSAERLQPDSLEQTFEL